MPERAVDESSTELEQGFCLFHFFQLPPTYIIAGHKRDQGEEFRIACLGCLKRAENFDSLFGLFFKKKFRKRKSGLFRGTNERGTSVTQFCSTELLPCNWVL